MDRRLHRLTEIWQELRAPLPPLGIPTPEANNRAIARVPREVIDEALDDIRAKQLAMELGIGVQYELPFPPKSVDEVV